MENLTGGTPPVRYLPCVVPCKLYFAAFEAEKVEKEKQRQELDKSYEKLNQEKNDILKEQQKNRGEIDVLSLIHI